MGGDEVTKLSSSLPSGDGNGLNAITRQLIEKPHELRVAICLVDCKQTTTDNDSGEIIPTARVRRIEVIDSDDIETAHRLMRRALELRTGQTVLPLDLEDELRDAFGDFDPQTGELLRRDSSTNDEREDD